MRDINALKRQPRQGVDDQPITRDVPPEPASAIGVNPLTPQPLDPSRSVTGPDGQRASNRTAKKRHPLLSPPVLVTAGLLVVLFEVALWAAVGLLWWAAINLLLVLVLLGSLRWALSWWRRQVAATTAGTAGGSRAATGPAGTGSRSPLGRLLGGVRSGQGRGGGLLGARSGGGGSGSGRKGGLGRLLSGGRRTGSGTAGRTGSGPGRSGFGLRGLLGGGRKAGGSGGRTRTGGSGTGGRRGGLAGAVGRIRPGGRGLLGRSGSGTATKRSGSTGGGRTGSKSRPRSAGLARFFKGVREGAQATQRKPSPGPTAAKKPTPTGRPVAVPNTEKPSTEPQHRKPDPQPQARTERRTPAPAKENSAMVQNSDDVSLQRWGRNLTTVGPAIEELARSTDKEAQLAGAIAASVQKLATQGETDLPAHPTVTAEASAIAAELKQAQAESEAAVARLRGLAARADALGASYRRNHEVDEARLAGERGSRAREKRADVGHAEQDT